MPPTLLRRALPNWFLPSIRNPKRNQLVDVLRGLAILMVLLGHYPTLDTLWQGSSATLFGRSLSHIREGMAYYGVALFFVISGFLITGVTMRRSPALDKIDFSSFWWLRFSRIMPMLLACLIAMAAFHFFWIARFHFHEPAMLWKTISAVLSFHFYEILGGSSPFAAWNPFWSLSVEEMFYLVFPFVCLTINGLRAAFWIVFAAVTSALYLRFAGQATPYAPSGCMDLLGLGCLLAMVRPERLRQHLSASRTTLIGVACGVVGLIIVVGCVLTTHPIEHPEWVPLLCGMGTVLIVIATQLLPVPAGLGSRLLLPMSALGVVSYELYLLQMPFAVMMGDAGVLLLDTWTMVLVLVLLAVLTHECFSEPMNRTLRELGGGSSVGVNATGRTRAAGMRRVALLCVAPLVVIGSVGWLTARAEEPLHAAFRISAVAELAPGTLEPLAYSGKKDAGQLVYLKHEEAGKLKLAIEYSKLGGVMTSALEPAAITGGLFRVLFAVDGVYVYYEGKLLFRSTLRCYEGPAGRPGVNGLDFAAVAPTATSTIVDCR